jgi:Protein of unknown function (DUF4238)
VWLGGLRNSNASPQPGLGAIVGPRVVDYHRPRVAKQKRHHYLSAPYLEGFSNRDRVWVYDRERHHYRHQLTREVAFQNYFYSFTDSSGQRNDAIERLLEVVESKALPLIRKLREQKLLRPDERRHVALFLGLPEDSGT